MPDAETLSSDASILNTVLGALSDPTRRALLDQITIRKSATATVLTESTTISRQGVMKHLAVLEAAGLVSTRKEGRDVLYGIQGQHLAATVRWMDDLAREWDRRLAVLEYIAESS